MFKMKIPFFSALIILALIPLVPSILSDPLNQPIGDYTIPSWVKNTAGWWSEDKIPDSSFIETIEFLIKDEMITVEIPDLDSEVVNEIPTWVKNTAGWWSEDKIPDVTFVSSIKYLMSQGIVYVGQNQVEESEKCTFKGFEVVCPPVKHTGEVKEFHIEVNNHNCYACTNWAHVGERYFIQIGTFDEFHGSPIDAVAITAIIISKDGEVRHNFGMITTEDGIYKGSIAIPSMDWYGENILSVTAEYEGIEKTIEKEFDVFKAKARQHCIKITCYTINSVSSIDDSTNLNGIRGVETYTIGGYTYVVAAAKSANKIMIYDISNPASPTSVGSLADGGSRELEGPVELDIATIGGTPYAVVAAYADKGIDIVDISDPTNPTSVGSLADDDSLELNAPYDVAITTIGSSTYAVVTGYVDDGVQIVDISDPTSPSATAKLQDDSNKGGCTASQVCLDGPVDVEIATIGGSTYAVVAGSIDDGIEIIDISTPASPSSVSVVLDNADRELNGANGIAITTIGSSTYAVVTGHNDDGISIIDISTPASPIYVSELEDGTDTGFCTAANGERCLDGPRDVEVETIRGFTYAIVSANIDDAFTIIDITNVSNPSIVASLYNSSTKELDGAKGISIATIGNSVYAIVGSQVDDGIEIIQIMHSYT